jgi:hypothetical protein
MELSAATVNVREEDVANLLPCPDIDRRVATVLHPDFLLKTSDP